MAISSKWDY